MLSVILDTNVLLSALRSKKGAANAVLEAWFDGSFEINTNSSSNWRSSLDAIAWSPTTFDIWRRFDRTV
jgi:predicted nucleic acid-binding protein